MTWFLTLILTLCLVFLAAVLVLLKRARSPEATDLSDIYVPAAGVVREGASGLWAFLVRHQYFSGWAPLCVAAAVLAWVVLGALDRAAAIDVLPLLVLLPVKASYALLALGAVYLVAKRSRQRLTDLEQGELHRAALEGKWGAVVLVVIEKVTVLCFGYWLLQFFSLPA